MNLDDILQQFLSGSQPAPTMASQQRANFHKMHVKVGEVEVKRGPTVVARIPVWKKVKQFPKDKKDYHNVERLD